MHTAKLRLSPRLKTLYSEIVPVLSGVGSKSSLTLFGRRREDPTQLEQILSRAWKADEPIEIVWEPTGFAPDKIA